MPSALQHFTAARLEKNLPKGTAHPGSLFFFSLQVIKAANPLNNPSQ